MISSRPVVYLAFANDPDDHLAMLKKESRDILKALQPLEQAGQIQIHREESSEVDEIYQDLLTYDQDVVIFHYGGHADGSMLQLEGGRGQASGLAQLLGQQKSLKLVFLNGCATKDQVELLHRAGVPAVIATAVKINDEKATVFSTAFYQSLAQGRSIEEAFESAQNLIETKYSGNDVFDISFNRFPVWSDEDGEHDEETDESEHQGLEWALYTRAEASKDLAGWRLDAAASSWQVQLRDFDGVARSAVDGSPYQLSYRASYRRLPAMQCDNCGSITVLPANRQLEQCRVCHSNEVSSTEVDTQLADEVIEFTIPAVKAERLALAAYESLLTNGKVSSDLKIKTPVQIWVPFWRFAGDVEAEYSGEAAHPDGIEDATPKLKWQASQGSIHTSLAGTGLPASRSGLEKCLALPGEDDRSSRNFSATDLETGSLVADTSLANAFETATNSLALVVGDEVAARLGGVSQRDVSAKFKYDRLAASLVWVPAWLIAARHKEKDYLLVVDGRTGAVQSPDLPGFQPFNEAEKQAMKLKSLGSIDESVRATRWASLFGGVGLGIMVGLLLGLAAPSTKSIVGIFIGAVGVALAALLGLNDRHFSVAKGIRIGSFGLAVAVSALSGVYIRDHGLLSPGHEQHSLAYHEAPVEPQVVYQPRPTTSVVNAPDPNAMLSGEPPAALPPGRSFLFSGESDLDVCSELQNEYEEDLSATEVVNYFRQVDSDDWNLLIDQFSKTLEYDDIKPALLLARDAICGFKEFTQPVRIPAEQCEQYHSEAPKDVQHVQGVLFGQLGHVPVMSRILREVHNSAMTQVSKTLFNSICGLNSPAG